MGYSCSAAADYTMDAIGVLLDKIGREGSNGMPDGGFYERGRENADGAITGTVYRPLNDAERIRYAHLASVETRVVKRGSYRVNADGTVARFPGLSVKLLREAEQMGAATYRRTHSGVAA